VSKDLVRCGVIGAGWWATTHHIPALKEHPKAELIAVQRRTREKADKVAQDFDIPHACTTAEELVGIDELDAVVISSTPNMHYAQAKAALDRGLHVLIEKPMTIDLNESLELVELAESKSLHFLVSCPWHYSKHSLEAKRLIQSGALGQLKMISMMYTNSCLELYKAVPLPEIAGPKAKDSFSKVYQRPGKTSYNDPSVAGGGHIYCQVSHVAGLLAFLTGQEPAEVYARFDNAGAPVDVYNAINVKLEDGTLVSIATHGATMLGERTCETHLYGTDARLFIEYWRGNMRMRRLDGKETAYPDLPGAESYPRRAPTNNLVDVVAGDAENGSPATLGATAMKVIAASCESVRTKSNVVLAKTTSS